MHVVTTPEADEQIDAADDWWRENRPLAPKLFRNEFAHAAGLLADMPRLGVACHEPPIPDLRRLLLVRTRFHVFYVVREESETVVIVGLWSAVRGRTPTLRSP